VVVLRGEGRRRMGRAQGESRRSRREGRRRGPLVWLKGNDDSPSTSFLDSYRLLDGIMTTNGTAPWKDIDVRPVSSSSPLPSPHAG
jgi:hypothetical protein